MPSIDTRARKSVFQGKRARKELETWLRMICAPILSTEGRKIKKKTGLVVNINRTNKIDERFDLLLDITAMGPPAVPRDSELITAKIKEELVRYFGDELNIGGWVASVPKLHSGSVPTCPA